MSAQVNIYKRCRYPYICMACATFPSVVKAMLNKETSTAVRNNDVSLNAICNTANSSHRRQRGDGAELNKFGWNRAMSYIRTLVKSHPLFSHTDSKLIQPISTGLISQIIRHRQEQMVIKPNGAWPGLQWMCKKLPAKLSDLLVSYCTMCVLWRYPHHIQFISCSSKLRSSGSWSKLGQNLKFGSKGW